MSKILLVEDNPDAVKRIIRYINKIFAELDVVSFPEAGDALQYAKANDVSLFILDIQLEDYKGTSLAKQLRELPEYKYTPIIFETALAGEELSAYRDVKCYSFLVKPFGEEEFVTAFRDALGLSKQMSQQAKTIQIEQKQFILEYGDDTVVRDSLKSTMDIEEKTYTALIGGITVIEFEDFREAKNTGNGQEIMVSYIGDDDDIIATYQDLAKEYSISQPEFWQSTETDMMFIVWGLVAILMIVLNMIEVIRRQKEVVVRASLGENAAVIALKAVVADMISYAALFVLAKLLVSQFISGAYEDHLILAVYCAGAVLSVIPYAAFVRFDVKKAFANASDKKGMFYLLNGLKVFATAMTIFTITTNLSSIQGNLLTNTTLLENHYNDYYFGVMQIEPPFEENEEESKESKFWNDLYENEYNTINPVVCIGSRISDTDNYIFVNHNARDMLQGFSDMLTEDDEKEDIVVFVPKGRNAESYKDIAKEEIGSLTQNAEELRVVYKEYSGREQFYYLNSNREEAIDGLSRVTNPIVIYQANEAVALNGSYIETGTYNGEVIYGCDESTIRSVAKKYSEQLGSHYFMLTNVGED